MRSCVVVVAYETPVLLEEMSLGLVGFMESFNLTASSRPAHTSHYVINAQLRTMPIKRRDFPSRRSKLGSLIRENLLRRTILLDRPIKKQHCVLSGWIPNLNRASYEPGMVILVADHT